MSGSFLNYKKAVIHLIFLLSFILLSVIQFYPVLQGKKLFQNDIVQYTGMAKEQNDFRRSTGEEPYWTDAAFGGMPTYQLGAQYPHNYIKKLDKLIRFLPRPADYLFLYFIGLYLFMLVLGTRAPYAFLAALGFGLSTYLIIILGVGHNAKAHAIAYFGPVLGGFLLLFQGRYLWGFLLTALAMALEINANHFQMTYYLGFLTLVLGLVFFVKSLREKKLSAYFKAAVLAIGAVILAAFMNATGLMATKEYANWSTRGPSELTINPDGSSKTNRSGLSKEYITEYSYGKLESLNLYIPRLFGGSNSEKLNRESAVYSFLIRRGFPRSQAAEFVRSLPLYWGKQPIVAAPAYVGAVIIFLALLALFLVKGHHKYWLLGAVMISLLLSWGKNMEWLTNFMIDYFPVYDKFRAVSSIQVILEWCLPVLAILGLAAFAKTTTEESKKSKALFSALLICITLGLLLFLFKDSFGFKGLQDAYIKDSSFLDALKKDRRSAFTTDIFRSTIYVLLAASALWLFLKNKIKEILLLAIVGVLIVFDLGGIAKRYITDDDFVQQRKMDKPFVATFVDREILKDTSHYRVYEPELGLSGARTSYFHKALGGYHAAKPGRFQELYDFYIGKFKPEVLNMLNVKYILQTAEDGKKTYVENPYAYGNAWFVEKTLAVSDADHEIQSLDTLNLSKTAVINTSKLNDVIKTELLRFNSILPDSTAAIKLVSYQPNKLVYSSSSTTDALAVFSEMHYPRGWKSYVDQVEVSHLKANYVLRALPLKAGTHNIVFAFEPHVVNKGSLISLAGTLTFLVLLIAASILYWRKLGRSE